MPFMIVHSEDKGYCVFTQADDGDPKGDPHGCHPSEGEAQAQMRALYSNVEDAQKKTADGLLVAAGGALKTLGDGKVGGYLITFGDETTPDLSPQRDFFDAETDFAVDAWPIKSTTYYRHGLDPTLGTRRLPSATLDKHEAGIWFETQLNLADEYEAKIYKLAQAGKLRLSSGSLNHLVRRAPIKTAAGETVHRMVYWPLGGDSSVAPDAADPRNVVMEIKGLPDMPSLDDLASGVDSPPSLAETTERLIDTAERLRSETEQVAGVYRGLAVKAGRVLSSARRQRLSDLHGALGEAHGALGAFLDECAPDAMPGGGDSPMTDSTAAPETGSPDLESALRRRDADKARWRGALALYGSN